MSKKAKGQRTILSAGTFLDERFEIVQWLGAGCFGAVYRARQLVFGQALREVALKLFEAEVVSPQKMYDVFNDAISVIGLQEEKQIPEIARHIIQIYDIGVLKTPEPRAFVSMKLNRGGKTLQSEILRAREHGMPVETSLKYLRQILIPLAWMHTLEIPVVHGDLKPDNILLTEDFTLVLTDFGLAGRLPLGARGGAIQYQSPETLLGLNAQAPADIYGIGLIWYEMLTGRHPFHEVGLEALAADDNKAFLAAHQQARKWPIRPASPEDDSSCMQRIQPASEINGELLDHPQLEAMLNRCLTHMQSDRYSNARVLLANIDQYLKTGKVEGIGSAPVESEEQIALPEQTADTLVADSDTLRRQGRAVEALAKSENALKLSPKYLPALFAVARAQIKLKRLKEAMETLAGAQQLAPQNPDVFEVLAEWYEEDGKSSMAYEMRKQANLLRKKTNPAAFRRI